MRPGIGLTGECGVQDHLLAEAAAPDERMIEHTHHDDEQRHQPQAEPARLEAQAGQQPDGEAHEVVGDLLLGQLDRAQTDDGQHPEQAEAEAGRGAPVERHRHAEHPDVQRHVGEHEVVTLVTAVVETDGE